MSTGFVCEVTPTCNLQCQFCYNTWRSPDAAQPASLSANGFASLLLPALQDANASWLAFSGGEPLLYADLPALMQHISSAMPTLKIGLLTNGTLLTEALLKQLISAGLGYVELSLFSASANRYQNITQSRLLDKAHASILLVTKYHLPLTIACTLLPDTLSELEHILLTAVALGADTIALNPFTPTGYGAQQARCLSLDTNTLSQLLAKANEMAENIPVPIVITLPIEDCIMEHAQYPNLQFAGCLCGYKKWIIDPEGNLKICEQNAMILGNLKEQGFLELSQQPSCLKFQHQYKKTGCTNCKQFTECRGGCRFR